MIERRGPARLSDEEYVTLLTNLGFEVPERLKPIVLTPFEEEYVRELRGRIEECETYLH